MSSKRLKTVLNWSSGKDASLAYFRLIQDRNYSVTHLLTTISEDYNRVFMHGVRDQLLDVQADRMGLHLIKVKLPSSPNDTLYKKSMADVLSKLMARGVEISAYGDIFLDDLKRYREQQLETIGLKALFPLWKNDTRRLVAEMEDCGIKAMVVCVNDRFLPKEFLGRVIDRNFLNDLPENVDPCGENGEYHTLVYDAPFFSSPMDIVAGEVVYKKYVPADSRDKKWDTGFYFLDVLLK